MSYAGPSRGRGRATARTASASSAIPDRTTPSRRPATTSLAPEAEETDWQQIAIFGAGLALGIAVGAGAALLSAPRTGAETRAVIGARARRVGRATSRRGRDAWADLSAELRSVKRALRRRKLRRAAEHDLRREMERETTD